MGYEGDDHTRATNKVRVEGLARVALFDHRPLCFQRQDALSSELGDISSDILRAASGKMG